MKQPSKAKTLMRMIGLVKPLAGFMVIAVVMGTLGFLCAQFIQILGVYAVLSGLKYNIPFAVKTIFILMIVFALLRAVFRLTEQRMNHYIAFTLLAIIRDKVFTALRRLCPAKLEGRDKGDLISLITSDVELLEVFYAHTISPICIALLNSLIMSIFIGAYHLQLGIIAAAAYISVGLILPVLISKRSGTLGGDLRAQSGELAAYMLENIRGLDETMQYGCGIKRRDEMNVRTDELSKKQGLLNGLTGTNFALAGTFILVFDALMLFAAGRLYLMNEVGFDGFIIPVISLMATFGPVIALANLGTTLQTTTASASRVLAILDEAPETEDITGKEKTEFSGASCSDVAFSYREEQVLDDLSVSFPENKIVGVVGKSGCGKSTMLKLLMRFWQTNDGRITLSGKNIEEINTDDLRDMESYMTQETQLFKDTIANNIRIGKLGATDAEVEAACKKAAIHDFIMTLPNRYETKVAELGNSLSGGERQRIGLARAFLHDAPFMLLDEPTSNLDSLNEAVILKSLKDEANGKSIALVSHRKSTVRIAEDVIYMEDGRVS